MSGKSIAIDGPAGAGKSTLARMLADKLGFLYVDTGAIYRTVGVWALRNNIAAEHPQELIPLLPSAKIILRHGEDGIQRMYLNGEDVTNEIRRPEISYYASSVSALPEVRGFLINMQRDLAQCYNVIMDGRDIGTVVLPKANIKIFLTAAPEDRAHRRYDELIAKGVQVSYEEVLVDLLERDKRDTGRTAAPLCQATDARLVDTTGKTLVESFALLLATVKERLK